MDMLSNDQWVSFVLHGAPQDVSRPIFEDLLAKGYVDTEWITSPSATDAACISKNGDTLPLVEFAVPPGHDAAIYSRSHVSCSCQVKVTGPDLPDIIVNAFGIVSGEPPIPEEPKIEEIQPEETLAEEPNNEENKLEIENTNENSGEEK